MEAKNQSHEGLLKAIKLAGSQAALARKLKKKQPHIFKWLNSPNGVPPEHCTDIEVAFDRQVTRQELRPNDWARIWPELADHVQQPEGDGACVEG